MTPAETASASLPRSSDHSSSTPERNRKSLPPSSRRGCCQICSVNSALYCCPRCSIRTCSLACCQLHKGEKNERCNGKRDRAAFCSLRNFGDGQLASDFHFLEDVLKASEGARRLVKDMGVAAASKQRRVKKPDRANLTEGEGGESAGSLPVQPLLLQQLDLSDRRDETDHMGNADNHKEAAPDGKRRKIDSHGVSDCDNTCTEGSSHGAAARPTPLLENGSRKLRQLVQQAAQRGVNLLLMPSGMERRKSNTTSYNKKKDKISWKVEFVFHLFPAYGGAMKGGGDPMEQHGSLSIDTTSVVRSQQVLETALLSCEVGKHLDVHPGNASTRKKLRQFTAASRDSIHLLLKCLPCSSARPRYVELRPTCTLREALRKCTIIEHPTIEVVMRKDLVHFPLIIQEVMNDRSAKERKS